MNKDLKIFSDKIEKEMIIPDFEIIETQLLIILGLLTLGVVIAIIIFINL